LEPENNDPLGGVRINEIFPAGDSSQSPFIELYNHGPNSLDLSGSILTDDPATNKYVFPANTIIQAGGFLAVDQATANVALSAAGGTIYLKKSDGSRVEDALRINALEPGVAVGRFPDGSDDVYRLRSSTPGASNSAIRISPVVINELMYHPISENDDEQYVELYNQSATNVDLSGWKLKEAIEFTFPDGAVLGPDQYFVVAKNAALLRTHYTNLNDGNTFGDFDGKLSGKSERLVLTKPVTYSSTNHSGLIDTKTGQIPVDEVTYQSGGRWPVWADGGGSSMELIDPRANHRLPANWADSDESAKASWTTVESSGVLDNGRGTPDELQMFLEGTGECLVDNVEVLDANSANRIANSTFENGNAGWVAEGTQDQSSVENGEGFESSHSFHVRAVERGDTGANRIRTPLTASLSPGSTATIRANVRWLRGNPEFLLRLRGNYLDAFARMNLPNNLGTPGAPNSRRVLNAPPAIDQVVHSPVLPQAGESALVTARVDDPDGVGQVLLFFRVDPLTSYSSVSMTDDGSGGDQMAGDGIYSAKIPSQPAGTLVAYYIQANDDAISPMSSRFPNGAPNRECLIRFGENQPIGSMGTYRIWMTQATYNNWANRSELNNTPLDVTFVYNNSRVIYNMEALYAGSPYISPGYNTPTGVLCGYTGSFPKDEPFLGTTEFVLDWPGRDNSAVEEQISYWIADQMGLPNNYRRYIHLHVNGVTDQSRGSVYEDVQQPGKDIINEWVPDDTDGQFYKIERWFEFSDGISLLSDLQPRLENYTTTGGAKKTARYRWNWLPRAVKGSANDYTNLFALVDAVNAPAPEPYTSATESLADMEEMMGIFAVERIVENFDSWGHEIGKNMYAYKPENGKWMTFMFDIDWVMTESAGHNSYGPTSPLFTPVEDPTIARMYNHPPFRRAYFRAVKKAVEGPLLAANINPVMDGKYNLLVANGVNRSAGQTLVAPTEVKTWVSQRRDYLIQQLAGVSANFAITSNSGIDFTSSSNLVTITGTAPIEVKTLSVNGAKYPVEWTGDTAWSAKIVLRAGVNPIRIEALDAEDQLIAGENANINITYNGIVEQPEGNVMINEIMYRPALPGGSYIELYNGSPTTSFDLGNWRIDGADFAFDPGTIISPGAYLIVAEDRAIYPMLYGNAIPLAGVFNGELKPAGETLELLAPNAASTNFSIVDQVSYADELPWPAIPEAAGASLQLIDPSQDNSRVVNWRAVTGVISNQPPVNVFGLTDTWKYDQAGYPGSGWMNSTFDDASWPSGAGLLAVEDATLQAPKNTTLTKGRTSYYFRSHFQYNGDPNGKFLQLSTILDDGAVIYLNGQEIFRLGMPAGAVSDATFSSRLVGDAALEGPFNLPAAALKQGDNLLAAEVHQNNNVSSDIVFGMELAVASAPSNRANTPGEANSFSQSLAPLPPLWINEIEPVNLSGVSDNAGQREPWLEIFNSGSAPVALDNFYLTTNFNDLTQWAFPSGLVVQAQSYILLWLDGDTAQNASGALHTNFRLAPGAGMVALVFPFEGLPAVLDYMEYGAISPDRSYGLTANGDPTHRGTFYNPTPGAGNDVSAPPLPLFINEWMASNQSFLADPADGHFDDWFEIYNPNDLPVDLTGYRLNDTLLEGFTRWPIPAGTRVEPHGFLLVWADSDTAQNAPGAGAIHAGFKLNKAADEIALFAPSGTVVDYVSFGVQTNDVSQGRSVDGGSEIVFLPQPTPGASNNRPPLAITGANFDSSSDQLTLSWPTQTGHSYVVQYKENLDDPNWTTMTEIAGQGTESTITDGTTNLHRFYRILDSEP
jgi:hypothetical protein